MSPGISASGSASVRGGVDVSHARAVTRRIPPILRADAYQHDVRLSGYPNRYTVMKSALVAAIPPTTTGTGGKQMTRLEQPAIAIAVLGLLLLDLAALDDITTGVESHFYYEYAMIAVSLPLLWWLVRRWVSATRRGSSGS